MVLTFGDERQYAGNTGYEDDPGKWYSYDSYVPNHLRVATDDLVIVCDRARALGIARIRRIESEPSVRLLQRCPTCRKTGIKRRKTKAPAFRCDGGHEFEQPLQESEPCTKFVAYFEGSFKPFPESFGRDLLRAGCPRFSDQLAMQEFVFQRVQGTLRSSFPRSASLIFSSMHALLFPEDAQEELAVENYRPSGEDERKNVLGQIRMRRGQQAFRDGLRLRYSDQCVMSGCTVLDVLEAAHIHPHRGTKDNHLGNGLLLRADLHTLFDLDLIGVEPTTLTIWVSKKVNAPEYRELHGRQLRISGDRPSFEALAERWELFRASNEWF